MKSKVFGSILFFISGILLIVIYEFYMFLQGKPPTVLTTPYGNNLFGISHSIHDTIHYFESFKPIFLGNFTTINWIYALSPTVAAIVFSLLSAFFLIVFARIRRLEKAYIFFAFSLCAQYISFIDLISMQKLVFAFYFFTFYTNILFIYLIRTLFSRKTHPLFHISGVLAIFGLTWLLFPESAEQERSLFIITGLAHLLTFLYGLGELATDFLVSRRQKVISSPMVRRTLAVSSLIVIFVPGLAYIAPFIWEIHVTINKNIVFYLPAGFPMVLLLLSLRYGFIYFDVPISSFFLRFVSFIYFAFLYWFLIGFQAENVSIEQAWVNIFYVIGFVFLFDLLRTFSFMTIHRYFVLRRIVLNERLSEISQDIHNPTEMFTSLEKMIELIKYIANVSGIALVVNESLFKGWKVQKPYIHYLANENPLWNQVAQVKESGNAARITTRDSGPCQVFLQKEGWFMMIPFRKVNAAVVLANKNSREPYFTEDIYFIMNLMRYTEPLFDNYRLLIDNVQHKRMEQELLKVSHFQKEKVPEKIGKGPFHFYSYNRPSHHVTGDYVDVIEAGAGSFMIFLGDVSGHSLASAYFSTIVRSVVHGSATAKIRDLPLLINSINNVLYEKQSAASLMTLCAMKLHIEPGKKSAKNVPKKARKKTVVEMVNAGQHPPIIYNTETKTVERLSESQPLLGALKNEYFSVTKEYYAQIRIIICSDGAFEIFDAQGDILGEERFIKWVENSVNLTPEKQTSYLIDQISSYSSEPTDDISLLIADVNY